MLLRQNTITCQSHEAAVIESRSESRSRPSGHDRSGHDSPGHGSSSSHGSPTSGHGSSSQSSSLRLITTPVVHRRGVVKVWKLSRKKRNKLKHSQDGNRNNTADVTLVKKHKSKFGLSGSIMKFCFILLLTCDLQSVDSHSSDIHNWKYIDDSPRYKPVVPQLEMSCLKVKLYLPLHSELNKLQKIKNGNRNGESKNHPLEWRCQAVEE